MQDVGLQILIGVIVAVIAGLILGGIYLVLGHYKGALKEKWQERRFRISVVLFIGSALFVFGIFGLFIFAPMEVALPTALVGIGILILTFVMLYGIVNTTAKVFNSFRKNFDSLNSIVK